MTKTTATTDDASACEFRCGQQSDDIFATEQPNTFVRACFECADERGLTEFN